MPTALQLQLSNPADYQLMPRGKAHYVAALKTKPGELKALEEACAQTWAGLTPVIEVLGPRSPGSEPFSRTRVNGWVGRLAKAVGSHPIFLDGYGWLPTTSSNQLTDEIPVLTAIYAAARRRRIAFVPVLHLGDVVATQRQVADSAALDGRGLALRVPLLGAVVADGRSLVSLIQETLNAVEADVACADLLMDLRHSQIDVEIGVDELAAMIDELVLVGLWRNVVLLGTAMPRSLGGGIVEAGTIGRRPRTEWLLWLALRHSKVSRVPTYGDFSIQNPDPPLDAADGQIPLGMRGAIRYTHETVTVIPRARAPRHEEGREQYRQLCRLLINQPEFGGRNYSWGDREVADCADGTCEPGWEDHWRGVGTSHHLRFVVDQLAELT